ncbi:MAG: acyl CoA:acetate/3-ketoacid CoA transferase [Candidatus Poribacteria bacterium]|nr:acyl CoA:acetate/3-ketoacid CoA transferase [Candidatus Poribacteria bacterium]
MAKPIIRAEEAAEMVQSGDTLVIGGSGAGHAIPEMLIEALGARFRSTLQPRGLTVVHVSGMGDQGQRGLGHLADPRLIKRDIGGHWGMSPPMAQLAIENQIEAYNLPQGPLSCLMRSIAAGAPGYVTHVGLQTFVDPRIEGGKLNPRTQEDLVEVVTLRGKEYLLYHSFPVNIAFIRGTTADTDGNISMEGEAAYFEMLSVAQAAKNSGGKVVAQVKRTVGKRGIDPRLVKIPGIFVDAIVVDPGQTQTYQIDYDPALCGDSGEGELSMGTLPLDERKVIAKRAALELRSDTVVNLGFGMPFGVGMIAEESGVKDQITLSIEQGSVGGIPAGGLDSGAMYYPMAIMDQPYQFDSYQGGGIDIAFLSHAQVDRHGNVNVSKFGTRIPGCGGFIDISQNAKAVVFCGTLSVKGEIEIRDGRVQVVKEGVAPKFVDQVEQITFSGRYARETHQNVLYVTERAVFELTDRGVVLKEVAPGVDIERDVLNAMGFRPIIEQVSTTDEKVFMDEPLTFPNFTR